MLWQVGNIVIRSSLKTVEAGGNDFTGLAVEPRWDTNHPRHWAARDGCPLP